MEELIKDILKSVENVGLRAFVFIEEGEGFVKIKGSFSDDSAVNFINGLIQERPKIKEHVAKIVNESIVND